MLQSISIAYHRWDLLRRIRKHGWTAVYVPDERFVAFSYTIGFPDALDMPEIIIFGADPVASNELFSTAAEQLRSGDLRMEDRCDWPPWEGCPRVAWRAVHPSQIRREFFNVAIWHRERRGLSRYDLRAFQLVFADQAGALPWEEGYDQSYRPQQNELWLPYFGPPEDD